MEPTELAWTQQRHEKFPDDSSQYLQVTQWGHLVSTVGMRDTENILYQNMVQYFDPKLKFAV